MKKLIITTITLLSLNLHAQEACTTSTEKVNEVKEDVNTPTPKQLEGATILVKMKDGTVKEMTAEQFKVVPRKQQFKVKERVLVEKTVCETKVVKEEAHKNIISAYVVNSQNGLTKRVKGSTVEVETEESIGLGLMYQRRFEQVYLGMGADTNEAVKLSVGLGF